MRTACHQASSGHLVRSQALGCTVCGSDVPAGMHAQGGDAKQRPIDMVSEYKCTAINVDMQATVGQRSAVDELIAASNMNEGAPQKCDSNR